MYLPAIIIVNFYFVKKRAMATGIAVCGSGIQNSSCLSTKMENIPLGMEGKRKKTQFQCGTSALRTHCVAQEI